MALLKKCPLFFVRLVPDRPNKKYNRENPTWEVQIRTEDPKQKKEWEAQGVKLKAVVPEDGSPPYWKTTLKKKILKKDGTPNEPVTVKAGNLTTQIDPATIGNGSVGNVRVFQYDYPGKDGKAGGTANVLMEVQLTKLVKYTPKARDDDFEEEDMEIIEEEEEEEKEGEEEQEEEQEEEEEEEEELPVETPKKSLAAPKKKPKFD